MVLTNIDHILNVTDYINQNRPNSIGFLISHVSLSVMSPSSACVIVTSLNSAGELLV